MTKAIVAIANQLGIAVHDHTIVGRNEHASMKGVRLIWAARHVGLKRGRFIRKRHRREQRLANTGQRRRTLHCATLYNWPRTSRR